MEAALNERHGLIEYHLRDGTPVALRPLVPDDREGLREGFAHLSPRARRQRFFRGLNSLSEEELDYLTILDQVDHVAWCAIDSAREGFPGMGLGRFVRESDDPTIAEAAVVVLDEYQGHGLGTLLFATLALRAEAVGIRAFHAVVLPDNDEASHWLRGLGATMHYDGLVCDFRLRLVEDVISSLPSDSRSQEMSPPVLPRSALVKAPAPLLQFHPPRAKKRPKRKRGEVPPDGASESRAWFDQVRRDLRPYFLDGAVEPLELAVEVQASSASIDAVPVADISPKTSLSPNNKPAGKPKYERPARSSKPGPEPIEK